ncbi:hypothetical protein RO3G_17263 [Rhizopus delemar RA 99-880]|uniref:Uncharacterized protein n=1 Tax=Rhizopus delemar (strain RA 99-880 / ATCC MYA-4621 / FGSC 9543 / NRRL 43880) TaxID=246409 RepID=I1CVB2_RHIO9|nr:hypothetical protein RO3G_17263 [Rhizopus delemar RA 99-880]|eukprot:EIE92392.1 hypothetical protein RO3G_17263 [Rhizopus delemar RA 99-880]
MAVVSVGAALAQMMLDEDKRELFKYRAEQDCTHEDGVYRDIFDGKVYQDFLFNQQQLFQDDSDIGIVLHTRHHMITLAIIPGPSKPDNIMSFLRPIVDEIRSLGNNGFRVLKDNNVIYKGKVHLMGVMGDIPGVADLMNHAGHMAYHGCRICDVRGVSDGARYFLHNGNIRSRESLVHGDPSPPMGQVPELLTSLSTFCGVEFFGIDEMHLIGRGIGHLIFNILNASCNESYIIESGSSYSFRLKNPLRRTNGMAIVQNQVEVCASKVPPIFEGSFHVSFGRYRAVDWQNFLCVIVPNIILPYLVEYEAKKALMCLINGLMWKHGTNTCVIKSTLPGVNSSNVLLNTINLQQYGITTSLANNDQVNADQSSPVSFVSHPSGNDQFPQLWDPADEAYLLSNGVITPDLRDQDLVVALRSYYRRLYGDQSIIDIGTNSILFAERLWTDSIVISSLSYRKKKTLTTAADNFVLFEAGRYRSLRKCWFVGEVYTYFQHTYDDQVRFLAVVDVMKNHKLDQFNIPMAEKDVEHKHFAVLDVADILECVGLLQYSATKNKFKVICPYMRYDDKVGGRHDGMLSDL